MEPLLDIKLTKEECQIVLNALSKEAYGTVANTVNSILSQANAPQVMDDHGGDASPEKEDGSDDG